MRDIEEVKKDMEEKDIELLESPETQIMFMKIPERVMDTERKEVLYAVTVKLVEDDGTLSDKIYYAFIGEELLGSIIEQLRDDTNVFPEDNKDMYV